jgi:hypothetical protein
MWKMLLGVDDRVMIVVTPAEVAKRAAVSFVDMPPVPRLEPADETRASSKADALRQLGFKWAYRQLPDWRCLQPLRSV